LPVLGSLQHNIDHVTAAHVEFLQTCIYAGQYREAVTEMENSIWWPQPNAATGTVQHPLRYFYLRGVAYMGVQNWRLAVRAFWTCLSIPSADSNVVSAVTIAAWKKLVLVQCCQLDCLEPASTKQSQPSLASPKSTLTPLSIPNEMAMGMTHYLSMAKPPAGSRSMGTARPAEGSDADEPMASPRGHNNNNRDDSNAMHMVEMDGADVMVVPNEEMGEPGNGGGRSRSSNNNNDTKYPSMGVRVYHALVQAFLETDRTLFAAIADEHAPLFLGDGNMGMVRRAEASLMRRRLYEVSSIYSAIGPEQLAAELGLSLDDTHVLLVQIASEGRWPIEIQDGVVVFPQLPPSATIPTDHMIADMHAELSQLRMMVQKVAASTSTSKIAAAARKQAAVAARTVSGMDMGPRGVEDI
jgi:hypothetical protein